MRARGMWALLALLGLLLLMTASFTPAAADEAEKGGDAEGEGTEERAEEERKVLWDYRRFGVLEISARDQFKREVEERGGLKLVEFYAPWCGHCKRLSPVLDSVMAQLAEQGEEDEDVKMKIIKVDATRNELKPLTSKHSVRGYPTLRFHTEEGEFGPYENARTESELLAFAERMSGPATRKLETPADLQTLMGPSSFAFVLQVDPARVDASAMHALEEFDAFRRAASVLQAKASFGYTTSATLLPEAPDIATMERPAALYRIESGHAPYAFLEHNKRSDNFTLESVSEWVGRNNHRLISALDAQNFRVVGRLGKMLILGAVDYSSDEADGFVAMLTSLAKSLPREMHERFAVGHIDAVEYADSLRSYHVYEPQKVVVVNFAEQQFYENATVTSDPKAVHRFVEGVFDGSIPPQSEGFWGAPARALRRLNDWYPWSIFLAIPFIVLVFTLCLSGSDSSSQNSNTEQQKTKKQQ